LEIAATLNFSSWPFTKNLALIRALMGSSDCQTIMTNRRKDRTSCSHSRIKELLARPASALVWLQMLLMPYLEIGIPLR
jgi:hypothetical protein